MSLKEFIQSKKLKIAIMALVGLLAAILIFAAGMLVGYRKAHFSDRFGENYYVNFVGARRGPGGIINEVSGRGYRNADGVSGSIMSINGNNLVIKDKNNNENNVTVTNKTLIKSMGQTIKVSGLKTNDQVVVLGQPGNNGTMNAILIRVFNNFNGNNTNQN